jgi:hypothetical protein
VLRAFLLLKSDRDSLFRAPGFSSGADMCNLPVRGEEPHPTRCDPVCAEHSEYKGVNLEIPSTIPRCGCRA